MYGIQDPRLKEDVLPFLAVPIWNIFWTLHETRPISQLGFQSISYMEIEAYSRLMQVSLEPYEVELLKKMDRAFITKINTTAGSK